jgi:cytochrome P450
VEEIREAFSDVEEIVSGPSLTACSYLRACIDECMRLSPPVPGALPREILKGGIDIDGHHLPEGVVVEVPHYAIHHNPEYYPGPFDYVPERWLAQTSQNPVSDHLSLAHSAFCPFSVGPRGCIGKGLAYVELTVTIARVLYLFDLRLAPGTKAGEGSMDLELGRQRSQEYQLEDRFASKKNGPIVQFRSRF